MHEQEGILMKDMPIIPIYYYTSPMMVNSKLKVILPDHRRLDFKTAYME